MKKQINKKSIFKSCWLWLIIIVIIGALNGCNYKTTSNDATSKQIASTQNSNELSKEEKTKLEENVGKMAGKEVRKQVEQPIKLSKTPQQNQTISIAKKEIKSNTVNKVQISNSKSINKVYIPQFEKKQLSTDFTVEFNTPWEASASNKFSATVEGKGAEAIEEGIANIIVKDSNSKEQWSFNLINNDKQYTPKAVKWINDENLLIIVGYGYGTVNQGGKLYILNVNTGITSEADTQNKANLDSLSEITKINSVNIVNVNTLSVNIEVLVYEDNSMNKNHSENRTITLPFEN